MGSFSIWHWLIVLLVVVLMFGTKKLRNIGSDLGDDRRGPVGVEPLVRADAFMDVVRSDERVRLRPAAGHIGFPFLLQGGEKARQAFSPTSSHPVRHRPQGSHPNIARIAADPGPAWAASQARPNQKLLASDRSRRAARRVPPNAAAPRLT